jgi:hypothetical protein
MLYSVNLGIAPHHPIGYNDGRFDEVAALNWGCWQASKRPAPSGHWPPHTLYELD